MNSLQKRRKLLNDAELTSEGVIHHKDDRVVLNEKAKELYEERGIKYTPPPIGWPKGKKRNG